MDNPGDEIMKNKVYPAIVVKIIDELKIVINKGSRDNIKLNQRFLVYHLEEEETIDPITKESLGKLELVKGTGKVIYIQEKMSIIESDMIKSTLIAFQTSLRPFYNPEVGDKAKPI